MWLCIVSQKKWKEEKCKRKEKKTRRTKGYTTAITILVTDLIASSLIVLSGDSACVSWAISASCGLVEGEKGYLETGFD